MSFAATPLDALLEFVRLLRLGGLRVGLTETQDALRAITAVHHPRWTTAALKATLVKRRQDEALFDRVFQLYFSQALKSISPSETSTLEQSTSQRAQEGAGQSGERGQGGGGGGGLSRHTDPQYPASVDKAARFLMRHVYDPSRHNQARSVQEALVLLSEMVQRQTKSELALDQIRDDIEHAWLAALEAPHVLPALEALLGAGDVDNIDFAHMDHSEAVLIEQQIERLIDHLLAKPKRRVKCARRGRIDVRKTVRASLQYGGAPVRLAFKKRHIETPTLFVLADISSSVEVFARFFLMLTRAFQATVSECRTFVFSDRLHEVSDALQKELEFARPGQAVERLLKRLRVAGWTTRRSDYGTTLKQFEHAAEKDLNRRSAIVILGDARNNQAPSQAATLRTLSWRVDKVIWLNPEREALWDSGDSIQSAYAPYCDRVIECRNLAQLRRAIAILSKI